LREGLQLASQLIVASPVRLPPKVVVVAKYVSLALGIWEGFTREPDAAPAGAGPEAGSADGFAATEKANAS